MDNIVSIYDLPKRIQFALRSNNSILSTCVRPGTVVRVSRVMFDSANIEEVKIVAPVPVLRAARFETIDDMFGGLNCGTKNSINNILEMNHEHE